MVVERKDSQEFNPSKSERTELVQGLNVIKSLEDGPREKRAQPKEVILLGGGGVTGRRYGPLFEKTGLPVSVVVDIIPKEKTLSLPVLTHSEYHQVSPEFSAEEIGTTLERFPNAALVIMTPPETHGSTLLKLGPLANDRGTQLWVDKPIAISASEAKSIIELISQYPNLAHQVLSGGYAIDKATAELILLGVFRKDYPFINHVKPTDASSPDFKLTYVDGNAKEKLGRLENVRFLFMEGREDVREVIGKYGRTPMVLYPSGGMVGDLMEHLTDKLIRQDIINAESEFLSVYLGYTPIGPSKTSFPWQVPKDKGLADIEGEVIMFGKNHVPVFLNWGKRGADFLGDIRRSRLTFENGVLETHYITDDKEKSNIFSIQFEDGPKHSYFIEEDPYILMLKRYQELWGGNMQSQGGLFSQLCNAILIEDVYRVWKGQEPVLFRLSPKAKIFRTRRDNISKEYQEKQQRDLKSILKMGGGDQTL